MREFKTPMCDNARWAGFVHRPGDIFVCTPPKCGTTWTQAIVNSLLFPNGDSPAPVLTLSPWLEQIIDPIDEVLARLDAQQHRRCIKSHTPADGIPWWDDARYLVVGRDPRDAFMSWVNHDAHMRRDVVPGFPPPMELHELLPIWLQNAGVFHHIATFWERRAQPNVLFVHYNDLKSGLEAEMRRIAAFLGIEIPADVWPAVVGRCTFEAMKARADEIDDFEKLFDGGAQSFLYKGTNGRWRDELSDDELAMFDKRAAELLPDDARNWLTHGRSVLSG